MGNIRKFTMGVATYAKMFRVGSLSGAVVDAVLLLRLKALPEDYFTEVLSITDNKGHKMTGRDGSNSLIITEPAITFTRDFYESDDSFDFDKVVEEFKVIWGAVNSVLQIQDVRRVGMVSESRMVVPSKSPNVWMRDSLATPLTSKLHAEKFHLRFEERELAASGLAPDPKKEDFINYIYQFYDSELDSEHPTPGFMHVDLDVQRYFAPVVSGKAVPEEVLKLKKQYDSAQKRLEERLKSLGAAHAKK